MEFKRDGCKRVKGAACSPSEGPCCNPEACQFYTEADNQFCSPETECLMKQKCNGSSVACPVPESKPDGTECEDSTLVGIFHSFWCGIQSWFLIVNHNL